MSAGAGPRAARCTDRARRQDTDGPPQAPDSHNGRAGRDLVALLTLCGAESLPVISFDGRAHAARTAPGCAQNAEHPGLPARGGEDHTGSDPFDIYCLIGCSAVGLRQRQSRSGRSDGPYPVPPPIGYGPSNHTAL